MYHFKLINVELHPELGMFGYDYWLQKILNFKFQSWTNLDLKIKKCTHQQQQTVA